MPTADSIAVHAPAPGRRRLAAHWAALVASSVALAGLFHGLQLPAALLMGPIVAAIAFAARETPVRVPPRAFVFAQAVVGCMIASTMPLALLAEIGKAWPLFVGGVGSVLAASVTLGWLMARWRLLPGTTAVWGSFPGAATAMVLMAEAFGADSRLVALMQYLRVLLVGVVATTVTRIWVPTHADGTSVLAFAFATPVHGVAFAKTLTLAVGGAWLAARFRIPAGGLLVPMFAGVALQDTGLLAIELPRWLLAGCYALVGWSIGLRFTPAILRHAARLLPRVVASTCTLIVLCSGLAWLLARFAGIDPLTAYLATSPGRGGYGGDHRERESGGRVVRDGHAVGSVHRGGVLRAGDRALGGAAGGRGLTGGPFRDPPRPSRLVLLRAVEGSTPLPWRRPSQCRISGCCARPV